MTLKRLAAPAFWPVEKKTKKFVVKPRPGPHGRDECIPLGVVIRDVFGYAKNASEARQILNQGRVRVDGVARKERGFPLGLMDVLSIDGEHYRIVPDRRGLRAVKIEEREAGIKPLRIENKTYVREGKLQLNFHDGKNILADKGRFHTGDVVIFGLEKREIRNVIGLEKGSLALIIGGHNVGRLGRIEEVIVTRSPMPNQVVVALDDHKITLPKNYVFVVGRESPAVNLGIRGEEHA